jgi:hypothetical protein
MEAMTMNECSNPVSGQHVYAPLDDLCIHCGAKLPRRARTMNKTTLYVVRDAMNVTVGTADTLDGSKEVGDIARPDGGSYLTVHTDDGFPALERAFGKWTTYPVSCRAYCGNKVSKPHEGAEYCNDCQAELDR